MYIFNRFNKMRLPKHEINRFGFSIFTSLISILSSVFLDFSIGGKNPISELR